MQIRDGRFVETHPHLAINWDFEKNYSSSLNRRVTPDELRASDTTVRDWVCEMLHQFKAPTFSQVLKPADSRCPLCVVLQDSLANTHPQLVTEWDTQQNLTIGLTPYNITAWSKTRAWWICSQKHSWQAKINRRTLEGDNCKNCNDPQRDQNDIVERTISADFPDLVVYFHQTKNKKSVHETSSARHRKRWWTCRSCQEAFQCTIDRLLLRGVRCPGAKCRNRFQEIKKQETEV